MTEVIKNDKASVKHIVYSTFFSWQNRYYPYNVLDVDFLVSQVPLVRNLFSSLENQTNKNFELYFLMNPKIDKDPKYEVILTTLRDSTTLPIKFIINYKEWFSLLKNSLNEYDFVIQSRMDIDDFIYKDAVEDTQSKIAECDSVLAYGYCRGYTYIDGELYNHYNIWNKNGHINIFESLILNSSSVKKWSSSCLNMRNFYHHEFKVMMRETFEKNNVEFKDSMFQQNLSTKAYIYFRHNFSQETLAYDRPPNTQKTKLTAADITKKQLEEEFGFFHELKSIE